MKFYKYTEVLNTGYPRYRNKPEVDIHYGFIDERKVDEYNDKVKVFVKISQSDDSGFYELDLFDNDDWKWEHISEVEKHEFRELFGKEYKTLELAIERHIKEVSKNYAAFVPLLNGIMER